VIGVRRRRRATRGPRRIGLFGLLGSGNLGNDGSFEAVLSHLARDCPEAELTCFCAGPERIAERYGIETVPLHWYDAHEASAPNKAVRVLMKAAGKLLDVFRTAAWVRRCDLVVVPGMGVLEATLPLRPWGFPYALLLLGAAGKLSGTDVALVGVGSSVVRDPLTRAVLVRAARLAGYRSYRDAPSRDAMRTMGVDVSADAVYTDLAFSLPTPSGDAPPEPTGVVGVGVMDYHGGNEDRGRAEEVHAAYLAAVERFVLWLVDRGRGVRLFTGDGVDRRVAEHIVATVRRTRPGVDPATVRIEDATSLGELMDRMRGLDAVVATRYHNVVSALRVATPTLSIGYASKNDVLMAAMGVAEFSEPLATLDVDRLVERFLALEASRGPVRAALVEGDRRQRELLDRQFADLSRRFLRPGRTTGAPARAGTGDQPVPSPAVKAR
jgi:polysaccharide pyruvyl transferase WcaK-like protein